MYPIQAHSAAAAAAAAAGPGGGLVRPVMVMTGDGQAKMVMTKEANEFFILENEYVLRFGTISAKFRDILPFFKETVAKFRQNY